MTIGLRPYVLALMFVFLSYCPVRCAAILVDSFLYDLVPSKKGTDLVGAEAACEMLQLPDLICQFYTQRERCRYQLTGVTGLIVKR